MILIVCEVMEKGVRFFEFPLIQKLNYC